MSKDSSTNPAKGSPASEATRQALVLAALNLFGAQGFDGTSTRELATTARANIGSISYHFGGKEGLRFAVADHIVATIQTLAQQTIGLSEGAAPPVLNQYEARQRLHLALFHMVDFVVSQPAAGEIVRFILRELAEPGPTIDRIYLGVFEPMHKRLCQLWQQATGEDAESEATRIQVFSCIGQVLYFRIGREPVMRRMDWPEIGPAQAKAIAATLANNLNAQFLVRPISDGSGAEVEKS